MIEIRRILCPVDFSDCSRRAFDHAVAIAHWYKSSVTVLHVYPPMPPVPAGPFPIVVPPMDFTPEDRDRILDHVKTFVAEEAGGAVMCIPLVRDGQPAAAIVAEAATMNADLIVIGSHGRSGFERMLLGSVAERVLRKAACPVLIVPPHSPDVVPVAPVGFKHILCAVDFSEASLHALNYAMSMAQEADGRLTVVHVVTHDFDSIASLDPADQQLSLVGFQQRREEEAGQRLATLVPESVATYCQVRSVMGFGKPANEILQFTDNQHADLIVLGVHSRPAVERLFFGSTAQAVVRQAKVPVLTIHVPLP